MLSPYNARIAEDFDCAVRYASMNLWVFNAYQLAYFAFGAVALTSAALRSVENAKDRKTLDMVCSVPFPNHPFLLSLGVSRSICGLFEALLL